MGEEADADWQDGLIEWGRADAKRAELDAAFAAHEKELRRKEAVANRRADRRKDGPGFSRRGRQFGRTL